MRYENFQNLEREEKNQEMRNGDKKGGMESPKFALSMSIRVCAAVAHHAPSALRYTPRLITHSRASERQGQEDPNDLASCAL